MRVCLLLAAGLLATALATLPHHATAQNASRKMVVCTKDTFPMSQCSSSGNPSTFSGYDVELLRRSFELLNLKEGVDFEFSCLTLDRSLTDILVQSFQEGTCDAATGAITLSTERESLGMTFSRPTYASSLGVLVPAQVETSNGWFFIKVFDWTLWLGIGVSLLIFPLFAYIVESLSLRGQLRHRELRSGLRKSYWELGWISLQSGSSSVQSSGTRIMLLAYGAMAVVLLNCYVAALTSSLTVIRIQTSVSSINDLRAKAVGTVQVYEGRLQRNAIQPRIYPSQKLTALGKGGPNDWLSALWSNSLLAFVYDEPLLNYIDSNMTGCELRMLEQTFEPFDYAIVFPNTTTFNIEGLNRAIVELQEDGTLDQLEQKFLRFIQPQCKVAADPGLDNGMSISFSQVWGVWALFGGCVAVGVIVAAILIPRRKKTIRRRRSSVSLGRVESARMESAGSIPLSDVSVDISTSSGQELKRLSSLPITNRQQLAGQSLGEGKGVTAEQVQQTLDAFVAQMNTMLGALREAKAADPSTPWQGVGA